MRPVVQRLLAGAMLRRSVTTYNLRPSPATFCVALPLPLQYRYRLPYHAYHFHSCIPFLPFLLYGLGTPIRSCLGYMRRAGVKFGAATGAGTERELPVPMSYCKGWLGAFWVSGMQIPTWLLGPIL